MSQLGGPHSRAMTSLGRVMADKISFDLVSPERLLLSGEAEMVTLPGTEGEFGVLPGHAPVISTLKPGVIDVKGGTAAIPASSCWADLPK